MEMLKETGWILGGESSGHILCLDQHTTGDGIVSALQVLSAVVRAKQPLASLVADFQRYPQTMINVPAPPGLDWQKIPSVVEACNAALATLNQTGRILIRPSGTEPVVRVMVEAVDATLAEKTAKEIAAVLAKHA
jgi:phosphoglucosamine mutase